jgi:hypothetical protein
MQNNRNTFNAALMLGSNDLPTLIRQYNNLISIMQTQFKMLQAEIANGITVDSSGTLQMGLASSTSSGALSASDWGTFNNKQDKSNELDALSALADTAGFLKKTGDATYTIDTSSYIKSNTVATKTGDYTAESTDRIIRFTASARLILPSATGSGIQYIIICDGVGVSIIVDANGSETINRQLTQTLSDGDCMVIYDTASGIWNIG